MFQAPATVLFQHKITQNYLWKEVASSNKKREPRKARIFSNIFMFMDGHCTFNNEEFKNNCKGQSIQERTKRNLWKIDGL